MNGPTRSGTASTLQAPVGETVAGSGIHLDHVTKSFGDFHAAGPLDLDVKPGEFVSIIGPSGCGKSTLMLIAAGLESPSTGQVKVDGVPLTGPQTDIGIVFQDHLLFEFRTAISNVLLQQQIRHLPRREYEERAHALFDAFGLKGAEGRYPNQLSGGMRQRVSIARALIHDPSVLLMDEPFGALDAITRTQIRYDVEKLWMKRRMSVIFITHSIEEAIGLSDRVIVMSKSPGRIVEEICIDLPRPRQAQLTKYPEFAAYADRIQDVFERLGVFHFT